MSEAQSTDREPKKVRGWRRKLLLAGIAFCILAVGLEAGGWLLYSSLINDASFPKRFDHGKLAEVREDRLAEIDLIFHPPHDHQTSFLQHPYLGYAGRPGWEAWMVPEATYNSWGFPATAPGPWPYRRTGDNEVIIGVLGGSVASAWAWWAKDNLAGELREVAPEDWRNKEITIICLATAGYKQPQQLFTLHLALLAGFEFDAIINLDGFNEIALANENAAFGANPLWPSSSHLASLMVIQNRLDPPSVALLNGLYERLRNEERLLRLVSKAPFRWSFFMNTLGATWTQRTKRSVDRDLVKLTEGFKQGLDEVYKGPDIPNHPYEQGVSLPIRAWANSSQALHRLCEAHNITYLHALQPNQYFEGSKPLSPEEKSGSIDPESNWGESIQSWYHVMVEEGVKLASNGVSYLDLTSVFKNTRETAYIDTCCHVNEMGNQIMGEAIAQRLAEMLP